MNNGSGSSLTAGVLKHQLQWHTCMYYKYTHIWAQYRVKVSENRLKFGSV